MSNWTNCLSDANVSATMTQGADIRAVHPNEIQEKIDDLLDFYPCICTLFQWEYLPVAIGDIISFNEWEELKDVIDALDDIAKCLGHYIWDWGCISHNGVNWSNDKNGYNSVDYNTEDASHKTSVNVNHDTNKFGTDNSSNQVTHDLSANSNAQTNNFTTHRNTEDRYDDSSYLSVNNATHYGTVRMTHYQTANNGN